MHSIKFTTQSGTVYEVGYSQTQEVYIRWEDKNGNPNIKGSGVKVWEFCQIHGLMADPQIGRWHASLETLKRGLNIRGIDRYNHRPISWATTKIVSIVRDDGKVLL